MRWGEVVPCRVSIFEHHDVYIASLSLSLNSANIMAGEAGIFIIHFKKN